MGISSQILLISEKHTKVQRVCISIHRGDLVSEQIYDALDKGKQRPTEYVYTVFPPKYNHYIEFQALITDGYNNVNDSDFISCVTQITP